MQASNPHTPSSPQNLRFMVDNDDSYGPPNIVGVENLHTQYREDKRLRVHDTPFEVRYCSILVCSAVLCKVKNAWSWDFSPLSCAEKLSAFCCPCSSFSENEESFLRLLVKIGQSLHSFKQCQIYRSSFLWTLTLTAGASYVLKKKQVNLSVNLLSLAIANKQSPFCRVERLMHKEQQYKERYLDKEA